MKSVSLNLRQYTKASVLILTFLVSYSAFATNGYFMSGYSIKSQGMGGVSIALPQDALTGASNPAGTAFVGNRFDLGLNYFKPDRSAQIIGNGMVGSADYNGNGRSSFLIPDLGVTKQLNESIGLGLSIYANGGMNTTYTTQVPLFSGGTGSNAGVNLEQLFVAPNIAWKVTPTESIGVSLIYARQKFSATGLQNFDNASYTSAQGYVTDKGSAISNGYGINLGWLAKLNDKWTLGAHYQTKISGRFDEYKGLFASNGSFDIPANYGLGITYQPQNNLTVALDIQRIDYGNISAIANPLANLTVNGNRLGAANGAGFGWQSINAYKLGLAYQLNNDLTLRTGFNYNNQPIPSSQTLFNILAPGTVQRELSLGFTSKVTKQIELSGFYSHALNQTIYGANSIPSGFGGGEANIRLSEDYYGVGIGYTY